jgi:glycosyltransferase involved in cell wall biosynthesis
VKYLFIHQRFPGQFEFLAPALVRSGHSVVAMKVGNVPARSWEGVELLPYGLTRTATPNVHPWVADFEVKAIRGEACFRAALKLKAEGYNPDVIIAHPGWGESLFIKDVWPRARLGIYCEFHYAAHGLDVAFDPEFSSKVPDESCRVRLRNVNNMLHLHLADSGMSPTKWQADSFPSWFRSKITVTHEGIDTTRVGPEPQARISLGDRDGDLVLTPQSEVVTFVNRNLEPLRGYHIFMRALPEVLRQRRKAHIIIVGSANTGYGPPHPSGRSWRDIFAKEVRLEIADEDWARVHFVGKVSYPFFLRILQISSVHVYLTYPFVLGRSLLEAMSTGCAVVASSTPPVLEVVQHGDTGRLVDFFDVAALSGEIVSLLGDFDSRIRLGCGARRFVMNHFDLRSVCLPRQIDWVQGLSR